MLNFYTDYVLSHVLLKPYPALFDFIRVRQYMLNVLRRELRVFFNGADSGEERYSHSRLPSDHQSPAKSVPAEERNQAAQNLKRWLQTYSQRVWDRILDSTVQGKPRTPAVDALSW